MNLEGNDYSTIDLNDGRPHSRLVSLNLYCGYNVTYDQSLEGGGIDQRRDFIYIINKIGKPLYQNALEWCSGPGVIGFELLGFNKTKHINFMDYHKPAIDSCIDNSIKNKVEDKVSVYLSDNIKSLPNDKKFDLVVANPPHMFNMSADRNGFPDEATEKELFENQKRIVLDQDMKIHKEFFANIRDKITDDADIFISEWGNSRPVAKCAEAAGFEVVADWRLRSVYYNYLIGEPPVVMHFRPNFSGFTI